MILILVLIICVFEYSVKGIRKKKVFLLSNTVQVIYVFHPIGGSKMSGRNETQKREKVLGPRKPKIKTFKDEKKIQ